MINVCNVFTEKNTYTSDLLMSFGKMISDDIMIFWDENLLRFLTEGKKTVLD